MVLAVKVLTKERGWRGAAERRGRRRVVDAADGSTEHLRAAFEHRVRGVVRDTPRLTREISMNAPRQPHPPGGGSRAESRLAATFRGDAGRATGLQLGGTRRLRDLEVQTDGGDNRGSDDSTRANYRHLHRLPRAIGELVNW